MAGRIAAVDDVSVVDWSQEYVPAVSVSRKRKFETISYQDLLESLPENFDSEDYNDEFPEYEVSSSTDGPPASKTSKLVESLMNGATEALMMNQDFIRYFMSYLPNKDLRAIVTVSNLRKQAALAEIQKRIGDRSYILLWKSKGCTRFSVRTFIRPIDSAASKLQAIIFFATSSMEDWSFPLGKSDFLPYGVMSSAIFADRIMVLAPSHEFLTEVDCKKYGSNAHAIEALCIPASSSLTVRTFSVPSRTFYDDGEKPTLSFATPTPTSLLPGGQTLKGILLVQYQNDDLVTEVMVERLTRENRNVPMIGGIVSSLLSDDKPADSVYTIAGGFAIYGDENVKVSTVAMKLDNYFELDSVFAHIRDFFQECHDGFVIFSYSGDLKDSEVSVLKERLQVSLPRIPIVGFQTYNEMGMSCFQGKVFNETSNERVFYPSTWTDLKISFMLVTF